MTLFACLFSVGADASSVKFIIDLAWIHFHSAVSVHGSFLFVKAVPFTAPSKPSGMCVAPIIYVISFPAIVGPAGTSFSIGTNDVYFSTGGNQLSVFISDAICVKAENTAGPCQPAYTGFSIVSLIKELAVSIYGYPAICPVSDFIYIEGANF